MPEVSVPVPRCPVTMSRKQTVRSRPGKKAEVERKRDERAARRALAKERRNRAGDGDDSEEFVSFANQLQVLGLRLREVPGDGNCLFRALGDQLEGHSRSHLRLRQETADYMVKHRQDFEPFVEDDVPFDRHVSNLAQPGTFAGNDAIVAFARGNNVNVVIHQLNNPLWQIRGCDKPNARELHIAYRHGEHYDSVRRMSDNTETPANVRTEVTHQTRSMDESNRQGKQRSALPEGRCARPGDAVQKVQNATGCADARLILQSLEAESYNIDSAIHLILQIQELRHGDVGSPDRSNTRVREHERSGLEHTEDSAPNQPEEENIDGRTQRVSNKQRKEQQRQQKKKRQEERHRQKVQELRSNNTDNNQLEDRDPAGVTVIKALASLNI